MGDTTRILAFLNCPAAYESEFGVELEQAAVFVLKAHDLMLTPRNISISGREAKLMVDGSPAELAHNIHRSA